MTILYEYKNGNYYVSLYDDGTKIKKTNDDYFDSDFPDSIDLKITNYCDMGCNMCHENSIINGKHASFDYQFLNNLHSGTELAIGGGNPLSHPNLVSFLKRMKESNIVCNLTVNERHFLKNIDFIQGLLDSKLIYGLGISMNEFSDVTIDFARNNNSCILHLICGLVTKDMLDKLYAKRLKILLLGYKNFGRGSLFYSEKIEENIETLKNLMYYFAGFTSVLFDNLALKQLNIKSLVRKELWDERFMGDDGTSSMYIDLVNGEFSKNSISNKRYKVLDTTEEMLRVCKSEN